MQMVELLQESHAFESRPAAFLHVFSANVLSGFSRFFSQSETSKLG